MYKKTVTYTDFNGNERTEDFYFHLDETSLTELQASIPGGYTNRVNELVEAKDVSTLLEMLKQILLMSYGVKSEDGRRFIRKPEMTEEFTQTPAYSKIYMSLLNDEAEMQNFIDHVLPSDLVAKIKTMEKANTTNLTDGSKSPSNS